MSCQLHLHCGPHYSVTCQTSGVDIAKHQELLLSIVLLRLVDLECRHCWDKAVS